jgi:hypothetical protein
LVEVLVRARDTEVNPQKDYPLRGTDYRYEEPFAPAVPPEEWEVLR